MTANKYASSEWENDGAKKSSADPVPDFEALRDPKTFAQKCFGDHCKLPFSPLHHHLFERRRLKIADPLARRRGVLDVVVAPRGAAKSTLVSLIFPLHALLFGHDRYIVLISATLRQSARKIANLRSALEGEALWKLFQARAGGEKSAPKLRLRRSTELMIELEHGRIEAFSAGAEMRGISYGPWRPTWIILDDVERGDRVRRERHRDALAEWFVETVENLGDVATNIDVVGTLLHPDALPARLRDRPDVARGFFASILDEARDPAPWDEWRRVYHNLADVERIAHARAFFEGRRAAMLAGAEVLWPEKEDYYALQTMRERIGRAAFQKEKQNDPAAARAGIFGRDRLHWFRIEDGALIVPGRQELAPEWQTAPPASKLADLRRFGFLDPALGSARGDYAAIATVGRDAVGYLYVLDVWLARAAPSDQLARIFDLHAEWDYECFGVEINSFQRLLLEPLDAERERRRKAGLPWDLPIDERGHRGSKAERILALEPMADAGRILFNEKLSRMFIAQMEEYPDGRHDDGMDALAAAIESAARASQPGAKLAHSRPRQSRGGAGQF